MNDQEVINRPLIRAWLWWALIWLTFFPIVGVVVSIKFHNPGFLDGISWLTFGRLRPIHVNGVIFGSFSTVFLGLLYYIVPRLCGVRMYKEEWGWWLLWLWNGFLVLGNASFLFGFNMGLEAGEFEWPFNLLRFVILGLITVQVLGTVFRRTERRFYVAMWYTTAALIWTIMNLILGNVLLTYAEDIAGVNSAAMHGLYIHYIVGLWITPAGLALVYYFLPLSAKSSLYSHKLSLLGFWGLAFFYPFVGTHHYLYSPIPHWTQTISIVTSMLLIIPVWTVVVNFFGTMLGRWGTVAGGGGGDNYAAKFLMMGAVYYLIGCFQGSVEALRRVQELTHFNDFVIAHSHLTVFGTFVVWAVGSAYYVWPRVTGRKLWSDKLASWHFWLTVAGFTVMVVGLSAQGFVQGSMLEYGANFVDTVKEMKPWWVARTLGGVAMDVALLLMVINFYKTAREGEALEPEVFEAARPADTPIEVVAKGSWIESPSTVFLVAGFGFFFLAVGVQGVTPWLMTETRTTTVEDPVTKSAIQVADYTPEELKGRQVYIREGCWYCHSQYVRPVTGESFRWGPVSQAGEYAYDRPHLFSTRRIGPDLTRVGRKYGDDWHAAHFWNPREVVPDSIMPVFPWLFEPAKAGDAPELNDDGKALVLYVQKLGTGIGDWREGFVATQVSSGQVLNASPQSQDELLMLGKSVYERRCLGCHGGKGDGLGPSARFMTPRPRDFTTGIFKFRSTSGKDSLPTDIDLYSTITHGLWGTAMPAWQEVSDHERRAVVQYIKTFSGRWRDEVVPPSMTIAAEPPISIVSLEKGKALFGANCMLCHGAEGKGDGPMAPILKDVWGQPLKPANFTLPAGLSGGVKLGHDGEHLYKTVITGIGGTPMPVFWEQLSPEEIWDIVHYVQSLRVKAHEAELVAAGLKETDREQARSRIWAALSPAARRGELDKDVVQRQPDERQTARPAAETANEGRQP
ncbi:MAG: cbb3-type cytochrome c oxidase subunit I [Nitrospira sp.]|nr:cbb3-type cytochrome c oxidase subunit I [Nitrospira sp.]